jgi:hypothetical protein
MLFSLMKTEKRMEPNMEPWTTPLRISAKLESSFPVEKHWDRSLRYDFIKVVAVESNVKIDNCLQSRSWITLSKAFEKSRSSRTVLYQMTFTAFVKVIGCTMSRVSLTGREEC